VAGRILIVDDEGDTRLMLRLILEQRGHEVAEAADGEAALTLMRAQSFDLVLLDIRMPGLDGWQVLDLMQAEPDLRGAKVVMISAHASAGTARNALDRGATAFVTKPFRSDEIGGVVERALSA
jgi:CheY-like chemotaxis protein